MRLVLNPHAGKAGDGAEQLSHWADLPGLCCQAAGGEAHWADALTAAWLLFYAAADLMDSVQDGDALPSPLAQDGQGEALGIATGLYFSAAGILDQLHATPLLKSRAPGVVQDFYRSFMVMTSGQYADLTGGPVDLDGFWKLAEAKSGAFFALGCRAGARLAGDDPRHWKAYGLYGHHLGVIIQVLDELGDIQAPDAATASGQRPQMARSLPVLYALDVLPDAEGKHLRATLQRAPDDPQAAAELVDCLDRCGASTYMQATLDQHRRAALEMLASANPRQPAAGRLQALLEALIR